MGNRLDCLLVERGLVRSRTLAQRRIRAGEVFVNGHVVLKPSERVEPDATLSLSGGGCPYVSRGGLKLERALDAFAVDPNGKVALDAGASRGGFTHCLLMRGARLVYALDVGSGQLAPELRDNERVRVMENRNLRDAVPEWFDPSPQLATVDLSFISLTRVLPVLARLLPEGGDLIALVKPQFEAGRGEVPRSGVVTKAETHRRVLRDVSRSGLEWGWTPRSLTVSPIRGGSGNIEYFIHFQRGVASCPAEWDDLCAHTVEAAHSRFRTREREPRSCIPQATSPR